MSRLVRQDVAWTTSRSAASKLVAVLLILLTLICVGVVRAEVLSSPPPSGRIVFTPDEVRISAGCLSPRTVRLEDAVAIPIADICDSSAWKKAFSPAAADCKGRTMAVLGIRFLGSDALVLAESFSIADRDFHIKLLTVLEDAHGPSNQIVSISRVTWCTDEGGSKAAEIVLPADSCREPRQFAAAFDYNADATAAANLIIWPRVYEKHRRASRANAVLACGRVQRESGVVHLIVSSLSPWTGEVSSIDPRARNFH